jgi:hypothetical protein
LWAFQVNHDRLLRAWGSNKAAPRKIRRFDMKNKKEQKTKIKPQNDKKEIAKSKASKTEKPASEPKRTIKQVVIESFAANSSVTNENMIAAVKAEFPKSAFKDTHAAWYRTQARKGLLTGAPIVIPVRNQSKSAN